MLSDGKNTQNYFESEIQVIIFTINNIEYALNILNISEIIQSGPVSPLPNSPDFIKGVINLRGKVIPVIDLRERFQARLGHDSRKTKIMIASLNDLEVGLIVDTVTDVLGLRALQIEPPLPVIQGLKSEYIKGIVRLNKRLVIFINIEKLLSSNEKILLQDKINEQPVF